jgi:undecaprenyl-diphosphatase
MIIEIFLALLQAATEFLPISSSGHLALFSNAVSRPNIFFFIVLHLASLIAVIIFTRKEIAHLFTFNEKARKLWLQIIVATLPAAIIGFLFHDTIESTFFSYFFLAIAFIFTGIILLLTRIPKSRGRYLTIKSALIIGLFQALALFPGVSRSGMTISSAIFLGIQKEKSAKFSFLLFIPLSLAAFILETITYHPTTLPSYPAIIIPFIVCLFASLFFLNFLMRIIKANKFWAFSLYCFAAAILSIIYIL